jgi:uncharacterized tellurite resistance protein B-like protein
MTLTAQGPHFAFEVVKLLLQVAWADHEVASQEADALREFARRSELAPDELATLEACLAGEARLPAPNLALLKGRRVDVMRAVRELLKSDSRVHEDEESILDQLAQILR